jgi:hypothetical protein
MVVKELFNILDGDAKKQYAVLVTYGKNIPGICPIGLTST